MFSLSKMLTAVLALKLIEDGLFRLTTPIADVIPEFGAIRKMTINVYHILTHTSGLPRDTPGVAPEVIANLAEFAGWVFQRPTTCRPGERLAYSALIAHSVLGLFMERVSGHSFQQLMQNEILDPLDMVDTSFGLRADLAPRICPVVCAPYILSNPEATNSSMRNNVQFLTQAINMPHAAIPAAGAFSTAPDFLRFAEMIRGKGESNSARILSPAMIEFASRNHTGEMRNEAFAPYFESLNLGDCPGYLGLGFFVRGSTVTNGPFGVLNSSMTLGYAGFGSTLCWVDPEHDLSLVFLSTGLMDEGSSWCRHTTLSDLVISSIA